MMGLGVKEINDFSGNNYTDYQVAYNNKFLILIITKEKNIEI